MAATRSNQRSSHKLNPQTLYSAGAELSAVDRLKRKGVLTVVLGNLVSGIFFGTGCIIVEHIDNVWWPTDDNTAQSESTTKPKVAARHSEPANDAKLLTSQHSDR
jgi:hypothetical protein